MSDNKKKNQLKKVEDLIHKAQHGDSKAFAQVYLYFSESIYRFCLLKTSVIEDAQDLTSETFKKAWRYLNKYKRKNFKAFIFTIARNLITDYYKKNAGKKQVSLDKAFWLADQSQDPEGDLVKKGEIKKLHLALSQLSDDYQEVIILRFIEELNVAETAEAMRKSEAAVRVMQHRAIKKLREILKK